MKKKLTKDDILNEQYINFVDNGKDLYLNQDGGIF